MPFSQILRINIKKKPNEGKYLEFRKNRIFGFLKWQPNSTCSSWRGNQFYVLEGFCKLSVQNDSGCQLNVMTRMHCRASRFQNCAGMDPCTHLLCYTLLQYKCQFYYVFEGFCKLSAQKCLVCKFNVMARIYHRTSTFKHFLALQDWVNLATYFMNIKFI